LIEALEKFSFSSGDLQYLSTLGLFEDKFLDYLASFKFEGRIYAAKEGELVFPQEPLVRIEADLISAQIVEGLVLNILNFQSLIATRLHAFGMPLSKGQLWNWAAESAGGRWCTFCK